MELTYSVCVSALTAAAYYFYNRRYFAFAGALERRERRARGFANLCFVLNYALFWVCSFFELPLVVNWALFAVFLFGETLYCFRRGPQRALYSTLVGVLCGLSVNLFCRSVIAMMIGQPLSAFDNNISSVGNYKSIPVLFGFVLTGLALWKFSQPAYVARQRRVLQHSRHLALLLGLMCGLFLYLSLNLLLFSAQSNSVFLKLWGVKSCVFAAMGFYLSIRYTLRVCELAEMREKNSKIENALWQRGEEKKLLQELVYRDGLTGLGNRQAAAEKIEALLEGGLPFTLCFVDLDNLKTVNDQHGHAAGDRYLLDAAHALQDICRGSADRVFRYGGDEFVVTFLSLPARAAEARLRRAGQALAAEAREYPMSLSFGAVESGDYRDAHALLHAADAEMYAQKQGKRAARQA